MTTALRRATYADIEALPPGVTGEILGGELFTSPRPATRHAVVASGLGAFVGGPFGFLPGGPGGWWILDEPELHLDVDPDYPVIVPDLAGWRRARVPDLGDGAAIDIVPDWVCEILSPSTHAIDRALKLPFYARAGVSHVWLLDPLAQTLEVYRLDGETWRLVRVWRGDTTVRAEPFDAVEIPLGLLWKRTTD